MPRLRRKLKGRIPQAVPLEEMSDDDLTTLYFWSRMPGDAVPPDEHAWRRARAILVKRGVLEPPPPAPPCTCSSCRAGITDCRKNPPPAWAT